MKRREGQEGQFLIEGLLLMVVLAATFMALTNALKTSGLGTRLVSGPWRQVAGMTETGVWAEPSNTSRQKHPNNNNRAFTKDPD